MCEEEFVVAIECGCRFAVDLAGGTEEGRRDVVGGSGGRPPEGGRGGEGEGVNAVTELAGEVED